MEKLAQHSNVFLKVSEFGLKDAAWSYEDNRHIVLDALVVAGVHKADVDDRFHVVSYLVGLQGGAGYLGDVKGLAL